MFTRKKIILSIITTIIAVLMMIALIDFSPQQSHFITTNYTNVPHNLAGTFGSTIAFWFLRCLGLTAYALPLLLLFYAIHFCFSEKIRFRYVLSQIGVLGVFFLFTALLAWIQHFYALNIFSMMTAGLGGILGNLTLHKLCLPLLGKIGSVFFLSSFLVLLIAFHTYSLLHRYPWLQSPFRCGHRLIKFIAKIGIKISHIFRGKKYQNNDEVQTCQHRSTQDRNVHEIPNAHNRPDAYNKQDHTVQGVVPASAGVTIYEAATIDKTSVPLKKCESDYTFPQIDLLDSVKYVGGSQENCEAVIRRLIEVLAQFGVSVSPGEIHKGPVITRYEVTPEAGVRVEKIASLDKNIALGLAAKSVRIIAPVPGKGCVGIELPNQYPASVHLREILESKNWADMRAAIPIVLGRGVTGDPIIYDLAKMPHLLIAGATGSGKTVCINAIIASLLYHAAPEDLRFIMVDPKIVEMQNYNQLPHMLVPVVTDPAKVPSALKWLIAEMELRYQIFAKAGVRNIANYNEKLPALQHQTNDDSEYKKFPYIVCIIDELADLMMVAPGDIETCIARLAQLARAAGIHLILATQRPSVNVITGIIKANLPCRIAFKVSSKVDSRTILDTGGAEALLGQGDMLFSPPGASGLLRAQGALVLDDEINRIVDFLHKKNGGPKIEESVQEQIESSKSSGISDEQWDDDLIPQALEIIRSNDQASASFLQRKLKIGYNRAARIMDTLREQGLVSSESGAELP